ncbi:MAG TPA: hypothetical protein VFM79_01635 [Pelobium sp.]|nr:hypothetical protein [Pelobium sp.]
MKKIIRSLFVISLAVFTLSFCEVAEPLNSAGGSTTPTTPTPTDPTPTDPTPTDPIPDTGPTTDVSDVTINFKVDNVSKSMPSTSTSGTYNKETGMFSLSGMLIGSKIESLTAVVFELKGKKSYSVASQEVSPIYMPDMTDIAGTYNGTSGTLVVTDFNAGTIKGTFSFELKNEAGAVKTISAGSFVMNFK